MKVRKYYEVTIKQGEGNKDGGHTRAEGQEGVIVSHVYKYCGLICIAEHTRVASLHWKGHGMAFRNGTAQRGGSIRALRCDRAAD